MVASCRLLSSALVASAVAAVVGCHEPTPRRGIEPDRSETRSDAPRTSHWPNDGTPEFELTPVAANKVREITREGQRDGRLPRGTLYLRVRAVVGGCQGFQFKVDLDPDPMFWDHIFETNGVPAVVALNQREMLRGTRVDYVEKGKEVGFSVKCPNLEGEALKTWLPVLEAQQGKER